MHMNRLTVLTIVALLATACRGDKVRPEDEDANLTPEQRVEAYRRRQAEFADSVIGNAKPAAEVAKGFGEDAKVGSDVMRDSLVKYVDANPQCFKSGRDIDPYLAGVATFYIHMNPAGSDVVRVQTSEWTSQAGNVVDKCFNEITPKWKFPMGMAKQGQYLIQLQFK